MPWPTDEGLDETHLNEGTDRPSLARAALLAAVRAVKAVIAARGAAGGVARLDGQGKLEDPVPAARLEGDIAAALRPGGGARVPKVTVSTAAPGSVAGQDGEIWLQREE